MKRFIVIVALTLTASTLALGQMSGTKADQDKGSQPAAKMADHGFFTPGDIKWVDAPPSLPPGAKVALLEGDPTQAGPFTMRLRVPAGYKIAPHWHPQVEHLTVISGTFHLGMGEKFDQSAGRAMTAGTFGFMPPEMRHFAWATEETIVQLHGIGPWKIIYVNPSDDPRNKK
ncbi:MAG TPA: cupin domain-containing protein [Pyrinomonadaceae bacterium]|nr:cupin domain-containing protein [Pyrinomonadaceae bacterium]